MEDEYDDTCSTVFPMLQTVLAGVCLGRYSRSSPTDVHVVQAEPKGLNRAP